MSVIISAYSKAAFNEFLNQVYSVIKCIVLLFKLDLQFAKKMFSLSKEDSQ